MGDLFDCWNYCGGDEMSEILIFIESHRFIVPIIFFLQLIINLIIFRISNDAELEISQGPYLDEDDWIARTTK